MIIFMDDGSGITDRSITFFRSIRHNLQPLIKAELDIDAIYRVASFDSQNRLYKKDYSMILTDMAGNEVWLSGVCCGYKGTAPVGAHKILKEADIGAGDVPFDRSGIATASHIVITANAQHIEKLKQQQRS